MNSKQPAKPIVVETFGERLESWYDRNGNWLNILLIVVLAGVIGYKAYDWMHQRNIAKANMDYGLALNRFQTATQSQDEAQKTDQMQGAITAAQQVVNEHGDMFVGHQAQLMIGNAQYTMALSQTGQGVEMLEKARDSFNKYIAMVSTNSEKAGGNIALGNVLENLSFIRNDKKLLEEAIAAYNEAAAAADGRALGAEAKLAVARAELALKSNESRADAIKTYETIAKNRGVQLVSDAELKDVKPIELESGSNLSKEQVIDIKNLAAWSQRQVAEDALAQLK